MPNVAEWNLLPNDPLRPDYRYRDVDGIRTYERRVAKFQDPWEPVTDAREIAALGRRTDSHNAD